MLDDYQAEEDDQMQHPSQLLNQYDDRNLRKYLNGQKNIFKQDQSNYNSGIVDLLFNLFTRLVNMTLSLSDNSNKTSQMAKTQLTQAKSLFHKEISSFLSYYTLFSNQRDIVQADSFIIAPVKSALDAHNERVRKDIASTNIIDKLKEKLRSKRLSSAESPVKEHSRNVKTKSPLYTPVKTEVIQPKKPKILAKTASFALITKDEINDIEYYPIVTEWKNHTGDKDKKKEVKPTLYTKNLINKYQKVIENYDHVLTSTESTKKHSHNNINKNYS